MKIQKNKVNKGARWMNSNREQYVEFGIGNEYYAIPIAEVHEIIRMQHITDIPHGRSYIIGVINLRGSIVPVVSLRSLFDMGEKVPDKAVRIVVVKHKEESIGIMVDYVKQVTSFADIQPPPERLGSLHGAFFTGIGVTDAGLVGILKLDELLIAEQGSQPYA